MDKSRQKLDKLGQKIMEVLIVLALGAFSVFFWRRAPLPGLANVVTLSIILLIPIISLSYVLFRLASREAQLKDLFKRPGILIAYLASKGKDVCKGEKETQAEYLERLGIEFDLNFKTEMKSEYGRWSYLTSIFVGSFVIGLTTYYLATSSFGRFLVGEPNVVPTSFQVALIGAFAWNLWLLLSSYDKLDLIPATFFWMAHRYVVAIVAGLVAPRILVEPLATSFALTATIMPYPRLLEFLRSKVPLFKQAHTGEPSLWKIQGMPQSTLDRLETLGVYTTQELAYADPLMILFRTNFQPKVVIDWIDQCILYNYVGEHLDGNLKELRVRGIRGSIELSGLKDDEPVLGDMAAVLKITKNELRYFRDKLRDDYQVKLISTLWDEFKPLGPMGPLAVAAQPRTTPTITPPVGTPSIAPPVQTIPEAKLEAVTTSNGEPVATGAKP